jgi:hypothetical protein
MEKNLDNQFSPKQIQDLQYRLRHFFVDYPHDNLRSVLWEMYCGWVYNSAAYVSPEQITDMMRFYETMLAFLGDVHQYTQYLDQNVLKEDDNLKQP